MSNSNYVYCKALTMMYTIILLICINKTLLASSPSKTVSSPTTTNKDANQRSNSKISREQTSQRTFIHSKLNDRINQEQQHHAASRHKALVDKHYYNKVYGSKMTELQGHRRHADIDYLKPGGSPWPWYEQAKVQYGEDKLMHSEQKREHKDYLAEYKKQFGENMRIYQESQRINLETEREGKILDAKNGKSNDEGDDKKNGKRKQRKKNDVFYKNKKDSKKFLN